MSKVAIRKALETALASLQPAMATVWENTNSPGAETYQEVWLMLAKPENPTQGDNFYRQRGYLQVKVKTKQNVGGNAADARADFLQESFKRGLSWTANGVTTVVEETPEIGNGYYDADKYVVDVFIRFFANIQPN